MSNGNNSYLVALYYYDTSVNFRGGIMAKTRLEAAMEAIVAEDKRLKGLNPKERKRKSK